MINESGKALKNITEAPDAPPDTSPDASTGKRAQEAYLRSEEDYKSLFEQSVDGIIIIAQSRIVMANNAYCVMRHLPAEKIVAGNPLDFLHPDDRKMAEKKMKKMRLGEQIPEQSIYRGIQEDGSISWIDLRSKLIKWKGKPAFQTIVRDITDRKRAEKMLTENEEKYRLLADHMKDQVWIMNLNLKWTYISPSAEKLWDTHSKSLSRSRWISSLRHHLS